MGDSLSAQASRVREGVQKLVQQNQTSDKVKGLASLQEQLRDLVGDMAEVRGLIRDGQAAGFTPELPMSGRDLVPSLTALIDYIKTGSIDSTHAQKVIHAVRVRTTEVRTAFAFHWRDYVSSRVPNLDGLEELASVFTEVGGDRHVVASLREAVGRVRRLAESPPTSDAISRLDHLANEVPEALRKLVGDDPQVRAFAEDIAGGGASVHALTGAVVEWMKESGFDKSFKIVPGSPAG